MVESDLGVESSCSSICNKDGSAHSSSSSLTETHENNDTPIPTGLSKSHSADALPTAENSQPFRIHKATESSENAAVTNLQLPDAEVQYSGFSQRSLAMHLYRGYQNVLACQEAMWEELNDRVRNRKEQLVEYGWEDDEDLEDLQGRKKFEKLIERYKGYAHAKNQSFFTNFSQT
jgi:hypothetical protein